MTLHRISLNFLYRAATASPLVYVNEFNLTACVCVSVCVWREDDDKLSGTTHNVKWFGFYVRYL